MRVPGGGAPCLGVERPGSGALPAPTARPLGGLPGPTTHWLWMRGGCGRGDLSQTPQRALLRAGFARCGGGMRVPGGGRLLPGCGASGAGRSPCNGSSESNHFLHQCDQNFNDSQMYISAVNFSLVFMFSVHRQMSPVSMR